MAQEKLGQDIETLREDVAKLRTDLSQIAKSLLEKGKNETDSAKDKVLGDIRSEFLAARKKGHEKMDDVEHTIQEKPFTSLLIAFLAGLILGKLFDRR